MGCGEGTVVEEVPGESLSGELGLELRSKWQGQERHIETEGSMSARQNVYWLGVCQPDTS